MESECANPSTWDGPVGAILGAKLYLPPSDDQDWQNDISDLLKEIGRVAKGETAEKNADHQNVEGGNTELCKLFCPLEFGPRILQLNQF